jgi:hypothetical protein
MQAWLESRGWDNQRNGSTMARAGETGPCRARPAEAQAEFVAFFCRTHRCDPSTQVTRIEWRYLD